MIRIMLRESLEATLSRKIGYVLSKSAYKDFKKRVDYSEFGGAPLLGVKGVCIICHGRSDTNAIKNAIRISAEFFSSKVNQRIEDELREYDKGGLTFMRRILASSCRLRSCAFAQSETFNHVQWTMTLDPPTAAPGATVLATSRSRHRSRLAHVFDLHAARADSDHHHDLDGAASRMSPFSSRRPFASSTPTFRPIPRPTKAHRSSWRVSS